MLKERDRGENKILIKIVTMEMSHPCRLFILLQNSTGCGQSYDGEKIRAFNNYTANTTSRPIPRLPLTDRLSPRLCVYSPRVWSRDARNPGGPTHAHSTHDDPARVTARVLGIQLMDRSWCTTFDNNSQGGAFLASISRRVEHRAPLC